MNERSVPVPPKLTPEQVALMAEGAVLVLAHLVGWVARRLRPAVVHLASDEYRVRVGAAAEAFAGRASAHARHAQQIAAEFER